MATVSRAPVSDEAAAGTWTGSAGTRYTLVDDYPDTTPTDWLRHGTTAGNITFGFTAFAIPAGSAAITVQVRYYDKDVSSGNNNLAGRLKVGGNYYGAASHNPTTTLTARSDNWATNPKTTVAWTVDDINGVGVNALQAFGVVSTDASPQMDISSIEVQVTYTPPVTADMAVTSPNATVSTDADVALQASLSVTSPVDTLSGVANVAAGTVTADLAVTSPNATLSGTAAVAWTPVSADLSVTSPNATLSATDGAVLIQPSLAVTSPNATLSGSADVGLGTAFGDLAVTSPDSTLTADAGVSVQGTLAVTSPTDTLSGAAVLPVSAAATVTSPNATLSADADVPIAADLGVTSPNAEAAAAASLNPPSAVTGNLIVVSPVAFTSNALAVVPLVASLSATSPVATMSGAATAPPLAVPAVTRAPVRSGKAPRHDARCGDAGTTLVRYLREKGAAVGDLTGATVSVRSVKPCGTVVVSGTGFTAGADGRLTFVTPSAAYWDCVGHWTWEVTYTLAGVTKTCDRISLLVGPP